MTRKDFLQQCLHGGVGLTLTVLAPTMLSSCASVPMVRVNADRNTIKLDESQFAASAQLMVHVEGRHLEPILVSRQADGSFVAVLMRCSHKGCELRAEGVLLTCPCHGSEFTTDGQVLSPPALENLERFIVHHQNSTLTISIPAL